MSVSPHFQDIFFLAQMVPAGVSSPSPQGLRNNAFSKESETLDNLVGQESQA